MKIGIVQSPVSFDKGENIDYVAGKIANLASEGADLVVLPEMYCCPYSNDYFRDYAEPEGGPSFAAMSKAAGSAGIYLVAGSAPEIDDGGFVYNTSYVFDRGGNLIGKHRKVHLFDIDVKGGQRFKESDTFTPGNSMTVFDTEFGRFGLCICFDLRFPELTHMMTLSGASAIFVPAAFNMTTGPAHWTTMFRQRAVDCQLFTIGAAPARDEKGVYVSFGNSIVVSPWGDVLWQAGADPDEALIDLDLSLVDSIRKQLPLLSARRTDLYRLLPQDGE